MKRFINFIKKWGNNIKDELEDFVLVCLALIVYVTNNGKIFD